MTNHHTIKSILAFAIAILLLACVSQTGAFASQKPNIVLLVADDLGYGDVGYHGSRIRTPHIDDLAKRGVRLEQFYVQPVCSPTRAALMTGRYPLRYGMQVGVVRPWADYGLPLTEIVLPKLLQQAGYRTAAIGKWHLGHAKHAFLPNARGFDHHYGCYNGAIDYYQHERDGGLDWHRNGSPLREEGYATRLIADEACRIIKDHPAGQPLFLYVPFTAVHTPIQAPEASIAKYSHFTQKQRRTYAAMTTELDDAIGRIVRQLAESELDPANTIIVLFSDNGGIPRFGSNGELRGGKGQVFEGGIRVPAIIVWDRKIPGGRKMDSPAHVVDLFPTLLEAADIDPPNAELDGRDLFPLLSGRETPVDRTIIHNVTAAHAAIRIGDFKIIHNGHVNSIERRSNDDRWQLFNIQNDHAEQFDLAEKMPAKLAQMKAAVQQARTAAATPLAKGKKPPNFMVPKVWGDHAGANPQH